LTRKSKKREENDKEKSEENMKKRKEGIESRGVKGVRKEARKMGDEIAKRRIGNYRRRRGTEIRCLKRGNKSLLDWKNGLMDDGRFGLRVKGTLGKLRGS